MQELPGVEAIKDEDEDEVEDEVEDEDEEPKIVTLDIEKNFDDKDIDIIDDFKYLRPKHFKFTDKEVLEKELENVSKNIKSLTGQINGRNNTINQTPRYLAETNQKEAQKKKNTYEI